MPRLLVRRSAACRPRKEATVAVAVTPASPRRFTFPARAAAVAAASPPRRAPIRSAVTVGAAAVVGRGDRRSMPPRDADGPRRPSGVGRSPVARPSLGDPKRQRSRQRGRPAGVPVPRRSLRGPSAAARQPVADAAPGRVSAVALPGRGGQRLPGDSGAGLERPRGGRGGAGGDERITDRGYGSPLTRDLPATCRPLTRRGRPALAFLLAFAR
jgi:hypothetical protein